MGPSVSLYRGISNDTDIFTILEFLSFFLVSLKSLTALQRAKTNKNLFLPRVNLNYDQYAVKCASVKTWNETPNEIRTSMSIKAFRKKYKDFLLSQ